MPTYDYECDACGHRLEMFQRMSEEALKKCPACGQDQFRRLFGTGAAIVFKGTGFYQTDYRSASYKSAAEKESKDGSPKTDSKTDTKTDSKTSSESSPNKTNSDPPKPAPKPEKSSE